MKPPGLRPGHQQQLVKGFEFRGPGSKNAERFRDFGSWGRDFELRVAFLGLPIQIKAKALAKGLGLRLLRPTEV